MSQTTLNLIPTPYEVYGADSDGRFDSICLSPHVRCEYAPFRHHAETLAEYVGKLHRLTLTDGTGGMTLCHDASLRAGEYR